MELQKSFLRLLLLIGFFIPVSLWGLSGDEILKKVDARRSLGTYFAFQMRITSFEKNRQIDKYSLRGYVRMEGAQAKTLIYFTMPSRIKGRKMLMSGNNIWVLFPNTRNIIRLTPLAVLLGQASNGDVARIRLSSAYHAKIIEQKEKNGEKLTILELNLKKRKSSASYSKIVLTVNEHYQIVSGKYFSAMGKLIKRVYFQDYQRVFSGVVAMKILIYDATKENKYTVMHYQKFWKKALPASYFNKNYLFRFRENL